MDVSGDGVGDLAGIAGRLDYLAWLGIDAIWIAPVFPSPMADFGYDVADYTAIDPLFGTLADFDQLLAEAHARGLRIILDFVPNHTSDQHPWFQESRISRDSRKRDWYIWRDPAPDGGPPNNWLSVFGGSAWELDEATGQYYYHAFLKEQPDLNWRNRQVRTAMYDALRFWLERGVDGFRVDVIWHLIKDAEFRDNPANPDFKLGDHPHSEQLSLHSTDQPEVHEVVAEMRAVIDEYDQRVLIGEIYLPAERLVHYYGANLDGAHLPFNFQLILAPWDARHIAELIREYESLLPEGAWPNWVLGNHDKPRVASRVGLPQARVAAMLLLTLRGTPTLYYGDELGMQDVPIPAERLQDPSEFTAGLPGFGRDGCRTPMQWDDSPNAGFSKIEPWLPVADNYPVVNVEAERRDPESFLSLHRRLLALRREHPALALGDYVPLATQGDLLAYRRRLGEEELLVALNLGSDPQLLELPQGWSRARVLLSTYLDREEALTGEAALRADEGIILQRAE
ncbi:MAG TPA: alpha-amylase family glycosyl hydrolase [Afifellaceae bacterium]|nr:alpha-amylase family glycosyl hydrolase [Afifellaceae bacterium]